MANILHQVKVIINKVAFHSTFLRNDNNNAAIINDPFNQNFSIGTNAVQISLRNISKLIKWAGQNIKMPLDTIDELGSSAGALVQLTLSPFIIEVSLACFDIFFYDQNFYRNRKKVQDLVQVFFLFPSTPFQ